MASCELSELAFSKIILHSFKYPSVAINGLLLGSKDDSSHSTNMKIVDAVPLFHHNLGLAPMLEVALAQV
jgi:ER membrane protein complex subunit 8/9